MPLEIMQNHYVCHLKSGCKGLTESLHIT